MNAKQRYPPPSSVQDTLWIILSTNIVTISQISKLTGPFDGVELPRAAMTVTSHGVEIRLPIHEADGITIAVTLCHCQDSSGGTVGFSWQGTERGRTRRDHTISRTGVLLTPC